MCTLLWREREGVTQWAHLCTHWTKGQKPSIIPQTETQVNSLGQDLCQFYLSRIRSTIAVQKSTDVVISRNDRHPPCLSRGCYYPPMLVYGGHYLSKTDKGQQAMGW